MSKVRIELNHGNIAAFLKGGEVEAMVKSYANRVSKNAGAGYAVRTHTTEQRVIANVYPSTKEAARRNYETNSLLKALH